MDAEQIKVLKQAMLDNDCDTFIDRAAYDALAQSLRRTYADGRGAFAKMIADILGDDNNLMKLADATYTSEAMQDLNGDKMTPNNELKLTIMEAIELACYVATFRPEYTVVSDNMSESNLRAIVDRIDNGDRDNLDEAELFVTSWINRFSSLTETRWKKSKATKARRLFEEKAAKVQVTGSRGKILCVFGEGGAGKTTLALSRAKEFYAIGRTFPIIIDGDALRFYVNTELGFTPKDRYDNNVIAAKIAAMLAAQGHFVIIATIKADIALRYLKTNHPEIQSSGIEMRAPESRKQKHPTNNADA